MSKKLNNQFLSSRMMLPEHKQRLLDYHREQQNKAFQLKELDEQLLEEFQFIINDSLMLGNEILVTILATGLHRKYLNLRGVVKKIDPIHEQIILRTPDGTKKIPINKIVNVIPN
jgi:hypothetical protein